MCLLVIPQVLLLLVTICVGNSELTVTSGFLSAHISSPVWQPFSFTGAPPNEVLWVGDQLHISISASTSGWREGLSLEVGRREG